MFQLSAVEKLSFRKEKTSVFLSKNNLTLLDEISRVSGVSRSKIINQLLSEKLAESGRNFLFAPRKSIGDILSYVKNGM